MCIANNIFEKAFKRLLELKCGQLLKTYKLTTLVATLKIEEFIRYNDLFRKIQDYYFDKRYPGEDYIETSKDEMLEVYNLMLLLKPVIERYISKYEMVQPLRTLNVFDDIK